jgi:PBSX family phage terminase large subunit
MPRDGNYLMCAKTLDSLKRNCLDILSQIVGKRYFSYSLAKKEACLMGRKIYLEGASDARAEEKIRGMTLCGAYCDEITLFGQEFFAMLLSRLSYPGAKLIGTTNPDSPEHWLKKKYLDRADELDLYSQKFLIDDNEFLSADFVENLKKEYTGVFYDRFICGEWVNAEGLVYPNFSEERHVVSEVELGGEYYISIDYGTLNPCSMGLWQLDRLRGVAVRLREFYYDGRKERRQMTDEEYYTQLEILAGDLPIRQVIIDPSAASFIACIKRRGRFAVKKADNKVLDGIRLVFSYLAQERLLFHESCRGCIAEFRSYVWDEEAQGDSVIKANDHAMDDVRYFCNTILRRIFR